MFTDQLNPFHKVDEIFKRQDTNYFFYPRTVFTIKKAKITWKDEKNLYVQKNEQLLQLPNPLSTLYLH